MHVSRGGLRWEPAQIWACCKKRTRFNVIHLPVVSFFPSFFWWLHRAENASYPSRDLCTSWDGCENPAWQCPLGNISGHREEVMISTRTRSSGTEPDSMNKGTSRPSFKTKSDYKKIAIQGKSWFAGSSISLLCTDTSVTMVKWWCILLE